MGMFIGHAMPGAFLTVASFWWTIQLVYTRIALDNGRRGPRSRLMNKLHRLPIEGTIIVLCTIVGFIGEMMYPAPKWTLIDGQGNWQYGNGWQHVTLYTFFGFYGVVNVMARTCAPKAASYEKLFGALAFGVEGFLLYFHTHGKDKLEVRLHVMLVIAITGCFLATLGEVWRPQDKMLPLIRILSTLLQGTWLWHVGIVLYWPPGGEPWDPEDMLNLMFTTVMFTWHLAIDIVVLFIVYQVTVCIFKTKDYTPAHQYSMHTDENEMADEAETKLLGNGVNRGSHQLGGSDSE